ncbi:MED7-domain-containing protein [Martensiomyces pterosporus]|nr:MED7-domain-containing protein [Martensiomyces pterosporus]
MASVHAQNPQQQDQQQQQQTGQQQLDAAFPAPPDYYSLFTDENIGRVDSMGKERALEDAELKFLVAPPAPTAGVYSMFGRTWQVKDQPATLLDQKTKQLYPEGPIDRVAELKKLNHMVVFEFLELVDILIKDPSQFGTKSERIHDIFTNAHHLINGYRGHQAKETLKLMLQQQIDGKRLATESILAKCGELEQAIELLKEEAAGTERELESAPREPPSPGKNQPKGCEERPDHGPPAEPSIEARVVAAGLGSIVREVLSTSKI